MMNQYGEDGYDNASHQYQPSLLQLREERLAFSKDLHGRGVEPPPSRLERKTSGHVASAWCSFFGTLSLMLGTALCYSELQKAYVIDRESYESRDHHSEPLLTMAGAALVLVGIAAIGRAFSKPEHKE